MTNALASQIAANAAPEDRGRIVSRCGRDGINVVLTVETSDADLVEIEDGMWRLRLDYLSAEWLRDALTGALDYPEGDEPELGGIYDIAEAIVRARTSLAPLIADELRRNAERQGS